MKYLLSMAVCLHIILSQDKVQGDTTKSSFIKTTWSTFSKPVSWNSNDLKTLGYIGLGASALFLADKELNKFFKRKSSTLFDDFEKVGYEYGKLATGTLLSFGMLSFGYLAKDDWAIETGKLLTSTLLVTGLYQSFFKLSIGRARPRAGKGNMSFDHFSPKGGFHSLPSRHTTVSLSVSLIMGHQVKQKWLKYSFYSLAGITMWSRLYSNSHWASDIFLGSALTYYVFKSNLQLTKSFSNNMKLSILPSSNGLTFSLNY